VQQWENCPSEMQTPGQTAQSSTPKKTKDFEIEENNDEEIIRMCRIIVTSIFLFYYTWTFGVIWCNTTPEPPYSLNPENNNKYCQQQ
jgi:hypothetical protein